MPLRELDAALVPALDAPPAAALDPAPELEPELGGVQLVINELELYTPREFPLEST